MTKDYFKEAVEYNVWVNNIVWWLVEQISDEQWSREVTAVLTAYRKRFWYTIAVEKA